MLWGCFFLYDMGTLIANRDRLNAETYCTLLDNHVLPTLWQFYEVYPSYFQDVNATCHVARTTMAWYGDIEVQRLDWSAHCPDLKPIDHLWDELERRLKGCH